VFVNVCVCVVWSLLSRTCIIFGLSVCLCARVCVCVCVCVIIEQWSVISLSVVDISIFSLAGGLDVLRSPTKIPFSFLLQTKQYRSV